jgi:hypothetical protein
MALTQGKNYVIIIIIIRIKMKPQGPNLWFMKNQGNFWWSGKRHSHQVCIVTHNFKNLPKFHLYIYIYPPTQWNIGTLIRIKVASFHDIL